ncbi:MAG TPA: PIN domain-containing protein [Thermoanaerobaculia bacterium]
MVVIVDSSVWIDRLEGDASDGVEVLPFGTFTVLPPLVIAELLSGELTPRLRELVSALLQDYPLHDTTLQHWMDVGELRRTLAARGIKISIPDAHVAQCALDLDATLLTRDDIFLHIARHTPLRLG